ncbi:MAG: hypothetical protein NTV32_07345 [Gammaproteobacteria bacterium]|jgi:hypothetical protein|nr:hypothetical protein [Gammaproteobacteria bacterium]
MRLINTFSIIFFIPCFCFAESNLIPNQPLQTNPLAQQFTPSKKNSNTQLYVTQFTDPGAQALNRPNAPSLSDVNAWINSPGQLLSNDVINRYGIGMQIGF